jgi:ABC-2 type transport system permease protein
MVRTAWTIARHELRRLSAERSILVFGFALPVIIITLVGLTFGSEGSIEVGVRDLDRSTRSAALIERLDHHRGIEVREYGDEGSLRRDVRTTDTQAGLVIPTGYGKAVAAGGGRVDAIVDVSSQAAFSALAALDAAVTQEGVREGAVQIVAADGGGTDAAARRQVQATEAALDPVRVVDRATLGRRHEGGTFSYTAPSNLVLFVFVNTFAVSTILAWDRRNGTVRRQLATPNRPTAILAGIGLAKLAFSIVQSTLILLIGALAFGVSWGNPLGAAALVVAFSTVATSVGLLIGATARDADQAQSVGIPLSIAAGMLGGCMWPLDVVPRAMQVAGHLAPHAWAMDAWQELIYDRVGIGGILPNLAVLGGEALVIGLLAARALRRTALA